MARIARVRNLQGDSLAWRDETERVAMDVYVGNLLFDFWHVAAYTIVTGAARPMMGVRLNRRRVRAIG